MARIAINRGDTASAEFLMKYAVRHPKGSRVGTAASRRVPAALHPRSPSSLAADAGSVTLRCA
jgi:hypothetical protein